MKLGNVKARHGLKIVCEGGDILVGDDVFFNEHCSINSLGKVTIGSRTLLGEGVKIYDHNHAIRNKRVSHEEFDVLPVCIGEDCWIGSNAVILKGVTICDGVTIGAGAVIAKSIGEPGVYIAKTDLVKIR